MANLRDYQDRAVGTTASAFARSPAGSLLLVLPPAAGKTAIGARVFRSMLYQQGLRGLAVAHRAEIVDSMVEHMVDDGIPREGIGIVRSGDARMNPSAPIQVGTIQTLMERGRPPAEMLWLDESHLDPAPGRAKFIAHYRAGGTFVLGTTATPERLDGRGLDDVYERMEIVVLPHELIENKWISVPRIWGVPDGTLPPLRRRKRDLSTEEADEVMNHPRLVADVVDTWIRRAGGRRTFGYAASVPHSRALVRRFRQGGVEAEHLDGEASDRERTGILDRLRHGKTRIVWSCDLLTTGINMPEVRVVDIARPTLSVALHIQMCGRAFRRFRNQPSMILDHAGNCTRLGDPLDETWAERWSLDGKPKGSGPAPMKVCPVCLEVCKAGCAECPQGHPFPAISREPAEDIERHLVDLSTERQKRIEAEVRAGAKRVGIDDEEWIAKVIRARLGQAA